MKFERGGINKTLRLGKHQKGYYEFNDISIDFTNNEIDLLKEEKNFSSHLIYDVYKLALSKKYNVWDMRDLPHDCPDWLALTGKFMMKDKIYLREDWKIKGNTKIKGFYGLIKINRKIHPIFMNFLAS